MLYSKTEVARRYPHTIAAHQEHDAYTCLLRCRPPDSVALWTEVQIRIDLDAGILVMNDSTLDSPYARAMERVMLHWLGKRQLSICEIDLIRLVSTSGDVSATSSTTRKRCPP